MLIKIIWNGIGILCFALILLALKKICKILLRQELKKIALTIFIGVLLGVVGLVFGAYIFTFIDSYILPAPTTEAVFVKRMVIVSIYLFLCTYFVAALALRFLPKLFLKDAIMNISIAVSLLAIGQAVFYDWIMRIHSMVYA